MEIEIRSATAQDFREVHQLIVEFARFIGSTDKVHITPEQMMKDQEIFKCIVAVQGEAIIGFATYFFSYYSWSGKAIYLDDLYVKERYRGGGIGSKMFDYVKVIGEQENCFKMKWQVSKWNTKAQEFYRENGASIHDVEINCDLTLEK